MGWDSICHKGSAVTLHDETRSNLRDDEKPEPISNGKLVFTIVLVPFFVSHGFLSMSLVTPENMRRENCGPYAVSMAGGVSPLVMMVW